MGNRLEGRNRESVAVRLAVLLASLGALLGSPIGTGSAEAAVRCDERSVTVERSLLSSTRVAGTYCRPEAGAPKAMVVLVPGSTYNRAYWDFPYEPDTYSFSRAMADAGYATFALDRLGTGKSSKPLSATVTATRQARAVHRVIEHVRERGFGGQRFETVLLGGHSLGSVIGIIEAATFRDVDGAIITSITHRIDPVALAELVVTAFHPAPLDPQLGDRGLDVGYLTTRPDTRGEAFHAPGEVDPRVVETDERTKDVVSSTEAPDGFALGAVLPYSALIDAPVLLAVGERDPLVCLRLTNACSSPEALLAQERPYYAGAPCVDAVVMPGVGGHDLNLHPSAPTFQAKVIQWADAVIAGACPEGSD